MEKFPGNTALDNSIPLKTDNNVNRAVKSFNYGDNRTSGVQRPLAAIQISISNIHLQ